MTKTSGTPTPTVGQTIRITATAPASAQFVGRVGTVRRVLGNAILIDIEGHGSAFVHLAWGTKRNPGNLGFEIV